MPKRIAPGEAVPLALSQQERELLVALALLPPGLEGKVRMPVVRGNRRINLLTLDDLDELHGHIAAEANHTPDKKYQRTLDAMCRKIENVTERYTDEE